jgi:3-oxo-5-alpha-steroid 4-dehydrogenase 1
MTGSEASLGGPVNRLLVGLFMAHYIQRSFVFPFLIRGGKPTPAVLVLMAFVFCLGNGYMQVTNPS